MATEFQRHRFNADEYEAMVAAGILDRDDRVELLGGEILEMAPIGPPHASCVRRLTRLFITRLGDQAEVSVQSPVRLSDLSEPEPDLALLVPAGYDQAHPGAADVLLVVEVADTTLVRDRELKLPFYAQAGVAETWIVDLPGEALELYRHPSPDGYREHGRLERGDTLAAAAFPDVTFAVDEILGR